MKNGILFWEIAKENVTAAVIFARLFDLSDWFEKFDQWEMLKNDEYRDEIFKKIENEIEIYQSIKQLSEFFNINRISIMKALKWLENNGYIKVKRRKGIPPRNYYYITPKIFLQQADSIKNRPLKVSNIDQYGIENRPLWSKKDTIMVSNIDQYNKVLKNNQNKDITINKNNQNKDIYMQAAEKNKIDYNSFVEKWNTFAKENGLAQILMLNNKRKSHLKARLSEKTFDFDAILSKIKQSDFLLGKKSDWKVDFDFVVSPRYINILEGKYDNNGAGNTRKNINKNDNSIKDEDKALLQEYKKKLNEKNKEAGLPQIP